MLSWTPSGRRVWNPDRLRSTFRALYGEESVVVLANRQPFRHEHTVHGIEVRPSSGGLVTALEPLMQACAGVWVAHGSGTADRVVVDAWDGLAVPPANPQYRLRRVWLSAEEERGYYYGFANEGLWPLCHRAGVPAVFRTADFAAYRGVNARFAAAVCEDVDTDRPLVLVQDYHFALAPRQIRARLPRATIVAFWHIPWPSVRDYARCPWARELLDGLLGSTIAGFQTPEDCRHFMDAADTLLNARVDRTRGVITYAGGSTRVRAYPVSIEWPNRAVAQSPAVARCRTLVRSRLGLRPDIRLCLGVDRMDYTKGINEKFLAVERLLECQPEWREQFVLVQIAEPSRECLQPYRELRARLRATADRINRRFGTTDFSPIILLEARHEPRDVYQYLRAADVCYVGSLHDGMNLVAKEFVSARDDERGVLILSQFAGCAQGLPAASLVNPYAIDECAHALAHAMRMPLEEQRVRMQAMRLSVARHNAYRWAATMLVDAAQLRRGRRSVLRPQRRPVQAEALPA